MASTYSSNPYKKTTTTTTTTAKTTGGDRSKNPYYDVYDIVTAKGNFHTQKELGGDSEYWRNYAVPYYDSLRLNGYGDIADELNAADYTKAQDILSRYKPDEVNQVNQTVDNFMTSMEDIGTGKVNPGNQELDSYIKSFAEQPTRVSDSTQKILDSWNANDALYGDLTKDHYNTGKKQLDYLNNFDITSQPYYDGIMAQYNLYGDNAAKGAQASGAAGNSGNIDSYAQANANRQQLAFATAGQEAARAEAQRLQGDWQTLYNAMSGNVNQFGATNAQNLATAANMYNADASVQMNAINNLTNLYQIDSAERQNALNNATSIQLQEAINKTNIDLANIEAEMNKYSVDSAERQTLAQIEAEKEMTKQTLENQLAIAGIESSTQLGVAGINADADKAISANSLAASKYSADQNLAAALAGYDAQKYGYDQDLAAALAGYDAQKYATDKNYKATIRDQQLNKYLTEMQLNATKEANQATAAKELTENEFLKNLSDLAYELVSEYMSGSNPDVLKNDQSIMESLLYYDDTKGGGNHRDAAKKYALEALDYYRKLQNKDTNTSVLPSIAPDALAEYMKNSGLK